MSFPKDKPQQISVLDLKEQYKQVGAQIEESVLAVLRSGNYILGQNVARLEEAVAQLCGAKYAVAVANGTDALILALWAANIGPGDEVITPPFTFAATAEAIALRGARAVFVDVDPATFNLDPSLVEAAITPRTKAIIPVHLYGQPADMDPILAIADRWGLKVIEDNAQAIGATYKGRPTGSLGDMSCISFYPTKNLGAAGDAGMVVTSDDALSQRLKVLRAHGCRKRYYHDELGVNSRLDEIQAAVLLVKLPHLSAWNERRNQVARWYARAFKNSPQIVLPQPMLHTGHVFHQYTIRIDGGPGCSPVSRDEVMSQLSLRGIGSMCYYPVPLHLQTAFSALGYRRGDFPVSEMLARDVLSLPMYPELTEEQVNRVASNLNDIVSSRLAAGAMAEIPLSTGM